MTAHWELIRSDVTLDAKGRGQEFHARLVSGQTTLSSEQYARRVGAERCILSTAREHGLERPRIDWAPDRMSGWVVSEVDGPGPRVVYIDTRTPRGEVGT